MRAWLLGGFVLCCAATVGVARAQECGRSGVERTTAELQRFVARQGTRLRASDGRAGRSFDVGEIAVLEDGGDGELVYWTRYGDKTLDVPAVARRFYRTHPDDYDFLTVFTSFPTVDPMTEAPFSAYSMVINNDIRGIHLPNVDYSADFGSAGNLEGILNMNNFADPRYLRSARERLPGNNDSTLSLLAHETARASSAATSSWDGSSRTGVSTSTPRR
jgi:hypothetical protein